MGLRKQTIFLSIISSLASPWVAALGLGEIKLKSTLNQPLNAEVALTQTKDLTEREILVGLASQADFARVGVDKPLFLGDLKFQVIMDPSRGAYVHITSSKAVVEPYLNFIVQAQWPSGKLLREYTVLVDLPLYGGDEADAVAPAVSRTAVNTPKVSTEITQVAQEPRPRVSRPAASARSKPPAPAPANEPAIEAKPSGNTYGPVAGNDTLWKIARENRPAGASIQQTMLAIQQLNPNAFINGNINLLRKGQTLQLPAGDAATQVAADEAARKVAANTTPRKNVTDDTSGPQLDASKSVAKTEARTANVEGRVKLSSSNSADGAKSGRGAGTDKGNKEALTNELTITKEELDAKSRETADLNTRLKAMDEQIDNTEKLIQVNSEEMLKLELAIEKNKQLGQPAAPGTETPAPTTAEVPASIGPDGKVVVAPPAVPDQAVPADPAATQPAPAATEVAPPPAEVKPVTPPPAPTTKPAADGLLDRVMENIVYVGAGLAVVLGLGLFAFKRRRKDDDAPEPWVESSDSGSSGWGADFALPAFDDDKTTTAPAGPDDTTQFHAAQESAPVKLETDDVVSESDIHIGFKDYGTAEKLLLSSLEQDPANSRVLLKLLEVYSRRQDINSFDRQYAKLRAFCDDDAKERAEQLRSYINNAPPFDSQKYSDEAFIAAVNGEEAIQENSSSSDTTQFTLGALAGAGAVGLAASQSQAFDTDFNFDASLDETAADDVSDYSSDLTADESAEEAFTLDFEAEPVGQAPSADRRSLAEMLAGEDGEAGLDLSDFDELSFDKSAAPLTSLDDDPVAEDNFAELDFTLDEDDLSEADFELNEDALAFGGEFDAPAAAALQLDESLDAGFDDLDAPVPSEPAEAEDEFADLDLSGLDYEMSEHELDAQLPEVDTLAAEDDFAADLQLAAEPDTDEAISSALAELDDFTLADSQVASEQEDDLDLYGDIGELSSELDGGIASETKRKELAALLDFEDSFAASDASELGDVEEASTPTLVMSAISEQDLPSADLDFDELDADLGALAADFEGDLADLDEFDAPAVAGVSSALMDEPVTQFGELDDVDPAEILGDGPKERPAIDLDGFDDTVTFAIEDPLTELDEFDLDASVQGVAGELGTAVNLDSNEDLVEFEDLDNLDNLADLDLLEEDHDDTSLELDDDALVIPAAVVSAEPEFKLPDFDPESDDDSDLGALCDGDELDTKLDLLRAFVDMGDEDSARHTLDEILEEGTAEQRKQANALMARIV